MPHIYRQALLVCTPAQAARCVHRFVAERSREDGVRIALRPSVFVPELGTDMRLERDVIAILAGAAFPYQVSWSPADDGAFPRFSGTLTIADAEQGQACRMVLDGHAPDSPSTLAHRVSQAVSRDFLRSLTDWVAAATPAIGQAV
jgi:hypothetical protein